jgi:hypothetical protein
MAMTTYRTLPLICECGHEGYIRCLESDAPFMKPWESFVLNGFSGKHLDVPYFRGTDDELLSTLEPRCPKCGKGGEVRYKG